MSNIVYIVYQCTDDGKGYPYGYFTNKTDACVCSVKNEGKIHYHLPPVSKVITELCENGEVTNYVFAINEKEIRFCGREKEREEIK